MRFPGRRRIGLGEYNPPLRLTKGSALLKKTPVTTDPIHIANAEHYTWGSQCDGWHLVRAPGLSVIQERVPPGGHEQRHAHTHARQFFFVLAGQAVLEVAGQAHVLGPQTGLEVPPGVPHQLRNESRAVVSFLVVSQPPSHGDRVAVAPLAS
jgi:mannose-6-phosphate isomerase-like protein (cupin superfamily)